MRAAPIHHGCTNVRQIDAPKDEYCARIDAPPHVAAGESAAAALFDVLDGCYDPLTVTLRTGALSIAPSRYFYESDQGPGEFCLNVFDNYEDSLVLGAMNMIDHEVVFDRAGGHRLLAAQLLRRRLRPRRHRRRRQRQPPRGRPRARARRDV